MSNSTHKDAVDSSIPTHDNEEIQETGTTHSTIPRESTNDSNASNIRLSNSTTALRDAETPYSVDQARRSTSSAGGASVTNTTTSGLSPAGQTPTGGISHAHTPRPNSHLESWRFDTASSRFVPHIFEGNMFGRPSGAASSSADPAQANETNGGVPRVPEIILQTSTDISVHGPDGQQLPPEASQFLLRMLGAMGGAPSDPNDDGAMPGSASGTPAASTGPNIGTSQSTPSTMHPPQPSQPLGDGINYAPHAPRSGPSFFDMLRDLTMLREQQENPPADTRRAKQLLRGLPVVSLGLIQRLQRVETLKARALAQQQGASSKDLAEMDNKPLCLVCYDVLLPEKEGKGEQDGDKVNEAMDDGMELNDDEDDMDLDVPTDVSPSDSKSSLPPNPNTTDGSTTKSTSSKPNTNVTHRWPYQAPNALIALPCTHVFHATCLKPWFETGKTTCPTCRFDIDPGSDSLDLADWLSPRRRRRQREQQQREQAVNGTSNMENTTQGDTGTSTTPTPNTQSTIPTPGGDAANTTPGGPTAGMSPHISQAIHQAMFSAISRAMAGDHPQSPSHLAPGMPGQAAPNSQNGPPIAGASNMNIPSPNSSHSIIPPPPPGFPFELLQELSRTAPPGYPIEGMMFGGSFDLPPENTGGHSLSPTLPGAQRSNSATPSARMQPTPTNSSAQSTSPLPTSPTSSSSTSSAPSGSMRGGPRGPFLSAGLGPNGMSPFGPFSSFLPSPFGLPTPAQHPSTTPATGSSTSYFARGSRPTTPSFRHHPYAASRPLSSQANSQAPTPGVEQQAASPNAAPGTETERNPNDGFMTTHTISFTFEIPLGLRTPHTAAQRDTTAAPGASQDGSNPETQGQGQSAGGVPPFGLPPGLLFGGGIPLGAPFAAPFGANPLLNSFGNSFGTDAGFGFGAGAPESGGSSHARRQKKKWVAPEGSSLRSVVEAKEREVGLRCDDISCLFGPEDEDEEELMKGEENLTMGVKPERVYLKKSTSSTQALVSDQGKMTTEEPTCAHRLHPECLLVSSRIADSFLNDAIDTTNENDSLEAACPICRTRGVLSVPEWRRSKQLADQA